MNWWEVLKNAFSLIQALLPLLEKKIDLFPINPALRDNVFVISIVLAAVAGLGGYQTVRRTEKIALPWLGFALTIVCGGLMFALTGGITFGLGPLAISWSVQACYILVFVFLGVTIGGFVGVV
jgi:hypothetical protein